MKRNKPTRRSKGKKKSVSKPKLLSVSGMLRWLLIVSSFIASFWGEGFAAPLVRLWPEAALVLCLHWLLHPSLVCVPWVLRVQSHRGALQLGDSSPVFRDGLSLLVAFPPAFPQLRTALLLWPSLLERVAVLLLPPSRV